MESDGTVLGAITLDDLLEEFVGEIGDAAQRTTTETRGGGDDGH